MTAAATRIDGATIAAAKGAPIEDVIGQRVALQRAGRHMVGLCPFHAEKTPSLHVYPDHFHCFGCGAHGDAIDFLTRFGRGFREAVAELTGGFLERQRAAAAQYAADGFRHITDDERQRIKAARDIWRARQPIKSTLGERYLRQRGLRAPWPDTLGFAPSLRFSPTHRDLPALVAAMADGDGVVTAVQRIFLDPETGRKAEPAKEAKRTKGAMRDGAVRFGAPTKLLGLAGSVEDALSARQRFSLPVWATCGEGRLGAVRLPACVERVIIFGDSDENGVRLAIKAAEAYEARGLAVDVEVPKGAKDWNEVVTSGGNRG
jgi:DNA primase